MAPKKNLETLLYPAFSKESGERMAVIRMELLLDQFELGLLLGTSQQQISKLENGRLDVAPFTLARMRAVFGDITEIILMGSWTALGRHYSSNVGNRYWFHRLVENRKNRSPNHWGLRNWYYRDRYGVELKDPAFDEFLKKLNANTVKKNKE